jgi:pyrimidine-nucleoside phosphorylase
VHFLSLIERKRDGGRLSDADIQQLVRGCVAGAMPDYQMAALLMAIYFRGLDAQETRALTFAMRDSGDVLRFPDDASRPVVDKHSTGGVGDKVSLPLAPLLACLGFRVPMISGRGLGITGGTLDKLESVPGFRSRLGAAEIVKQVEETGCVICGQTETICPADRLLYALRDATGTVPSIPLITASILSKKLAEGIGALVLDVKFGSAAFMKTLEDARELAMAMTQIAGECGVKTRAILTDMNAPLGRAAGNWLEVKEAVACLQGLGPADLRELVVECAAQLLVVTHKAADAASGRRRANDVLASGAPLRKWNEMLQAQGADMDAFFRKLGVDHCAPAVMDVTAHQQGFVSRVDARVIGEVVRDLGAGRTTKEAPIDFDVGMDQIAALGERVERGSVLCRVHARTDGAAMAAVQRLGAAIQIGTEPIATQPRVAAIH